MASTIITRVTCRWDDQCGVEPGWYAESWAGSEMVDDSQKVWFPVDVDCFAHDDVSGLTEAMKEAFPEADVEISH